MSIEYLWPGVSEKINRLLVSIQVLPAPNQTPTDDRPFTDSMHVHNKQAIVSQRR